MKKIMLSSMSGQAEKLRILLWIQGIGVDMSRRRAIQYIPGLAARGIEAEVMEKGGSFLQRLVQYRSFSKFDAVVIQRYRLLPWDIAVARRAAKGLIFDFDDAVMYPNSLSGKRESRSRMNRFRRMVSAVDCVFAGNAFLSSKASEFCDDVVTVPTSIDPCAYTARTWPDRDPDLLTVGWIGAPTSLHYLEALRDVWDSLYDACPRLRLKIVSRKFFDCARMPVIKKEQRHEEEAEDLKTFDIGLMPLTMDTWSEGKCALKILQCHAAGVPVVCTPVGMNREVVVEGETGYHASTPAEWIEKIIRLVDDRAGRIRMGDEGRRRLIEKYSIESVLPRMAEAIRRVAAKGKAGRMGGG